MIELADYSQDVLDGMSTIKLAETLRHYSHPLLDAAANSILYLAAQEGLLEEAQQAAERARTELKESKQPLSEQMARLNRRVIDLTAELDALRFTLPQSRKGTMSPEYLEELANVADPDKLWQLSGLDQMNLPEEKRRQLDIGVALRRYASHVQHLRKLQAIERSLLITPLSENSSAHMEVDTPPEHQQLRTIRKASIGDA